MRLRGAEGRTSPRRRGQERVQHEPRGYGRVPGAPSLGRAHHRGAEGRIDCELPFGRGVLAVSTMCPVGRRPRAWARTSTTSASCPAILQRPYTLPGGHGISSYSLQKNLSSRDQSHMRWSGRTVRMCIAARRESRGRAVGHDGSHVWELVRKEGCGLDCGRSGGGGGGARPRAVGGARRHLAHAGCDID